MDVLNVVVMLCWYCMIVVTAWMMVSFLGGCGHVVCTVTVWKRSISFIVVMIGMNVDGCGGGEDC